MPDEKKEESKKPAQRFIYDGEDAAHIFRLGDIGTVFDKTEKNESFFSLKSILKKITISNKKLRK